MKRYLTLFVTICMLSACSLPFTEKMPKEQLFRLTLPENDGPSPAVPQYGSLRISVVNVGLGLQTDQIMAWDNFELLPIIGVRWAEISSDLIEKTFTYYLSQQGLFSYVTSDPLGRTADMALELDLQEFYLIVKNGTPSHVRVTLFAQLISANSGNTIASGNFKNSVALEGGNTDATILAFSKAVERTMEDILEKLANSKIN